MNEKFTDCKTPGQLIEAALKEKSWTQRVLAIVLGVDETGINKIIADKRTISAEMALHLEEVLDVPAAQFLRLQAEYDLAKARIVAKPNPKRATRAHLYAGLPVSEMIKRGWLDATDVRNTERVEAELARFFGVDRVEDIEVLPHAAKKTAVNSPATPAQIAWLSRVRQIALEMLVPKYSQLAGRRAIERLQPLLSAAEEVRKVPRILAEAGIRFLLVESLPHAKIDGVCFWLNDHAPVIALSMRYDRIDNFWFVLRHELEHVIQGDGKEAAILDDLEGERASTSSSALLPEEERVANQAASEFCVPQKSMDSFIARKAPFFAERDLLGMAATLKIHPGLVAGLLQHRTGRYDRFRAHLVKVRSLVAPSAIVDGWGDVAPIGD
ncbi:HigA family addiction module antitoxin [Janthinobacterium sp. MDB2-8]|uniref:HigA family addiction module antitoxin n=1 Tax=Janthinobacterium sp. MDB2-8 TaxID=1259338 RepID=UPI003F1E8773